jgi:hypothetical protein
MSFSFKQYLKILESDELSDERLTEIFGVFKNNAKIDKLRAAHAARRPSGTRGTDQAEKAKDAAWASKKKEVEDDGDDVDDIDPKTGKPIIKPSNKTSTQAQDRRGELEWARKLMADNA